MTPEIIAAQREMIKYSKRYRFIPGKDMNVYAVVNGNSIDVRDDRTLCANEFPKRIWKFRFAPKQFYINEIRNSFEIELECHKFGLSGGVRLKIEPKTSSRSITLLFMKCGETVEDGNERIYRVTLEGLKGILQESFDEAVEKTDGQAEDADYMTKLIETVNKTGEFANYDFNVLSIEKIE